MYFFVQNYSSPLIFDLAVKELYISALVLNSLPWSDLNKFAVRVTFLILYCIFLSEFSCRPLIFDLSAKELYLSPLFLGTLPLSDVDEIRSAHLFYDYLLYSSVLNSEFFYFRLWKLVLTYIKQILTSSYIVRT